GSAEQRTGVAARRTIAEDFDRSIEPDRDRALVEQRAGTWVDIRAAARGDDLNPPVEQARDQPPFAVAEVLLAISFEDLCRAQACSVLNRRIAIDERQAQPPRQAPSNS